MTPAEVLLADLKAGGVAVWATGGKIHFRGPPLQEDVKRKLRQHKPALLELLRPQVFPCVACGKHWFYKPETRCYWCQSILTEKIRAKKAVGFAG